MINKHLKQALLFKVGSEILFESTKKWLGYDENGNEVIRSRKEHIKHLADDLPKVSKAYQKFLKGEK